MTVNHRAEAEKHLATAARHLTEHPGDMRIAEVAAAIGQGHAALARESEATSTAADVREALQSLRRRFTDTQSLVATHIAEGLASGEANRWKAAVELRSALDEACCNVDDLVDTQLTDEGVDPRSACKAPTYTAPSDTGWSDPWAAAPDIAASIPEPIQRVLAGHLAEMLLDQSEDEVRKWARGIAFELKREGLDLGNAIKKRITDLTLGPDPADPPF
ncbi:hypothetical protein ACIREK_31120 [Streptomyces sp. NPDC102415]|uniref:hypothetical protein n=1 Tax=Streptomyces sp. NPDC102415 TaxID=3366173 RepID=UPI0037F518ED